MKFYEIKPYDELISLEKRSEKLCDYIRQEFLNLIESVFGKNSGINVYSLSALHGYITIDNFPDPENTDLADFKGLACELGIPRVLFEDRVTRKFYEI